MSGRPATDDHPRRLIIRPNASLPFGWAVYLLVGMCVWSFGIAAGLALLGYWMVFPFSGLEMLALAGALWWGLRDNSYREVVCVDDRYVRVESGWRHPQRHWQYERAWAQLRLEPGPYASSPTRLWLGSHGKGCILGGCLTNEEREAVARKLRHWLRADKVGASADRNWR